MPPVEIFQGSSPVILAMPHSGVFVPKDIRVNLNETGLALADTDWHVDRLYSGLFADATVVKATFHRYVIDANRDPSGESLYPGQNTTALCPTTDFEGVSIYHRGAEPSILEIEQRLVNYHAAYHAALQAEIVRIRAVHGIAVLYDCHSIRSKIGYLFEGVLPDFNIGTNDARTCAPELESAVFDACTKANDFTSVLNGRFKGGWTTRHYGDPLRHVHAIQMELAQSTYMSEMAPWTYNDQKAETVRAVLGDVLGELEQRALNLR